MSPARLVLLLVLAYLAVFVQAGWDAPRLWLGSHLSLVPVLMVYAALRLDLLAVTLLSLAAGLWLDSLSANPLGASVLPLFLTGWLLWRRRELLLRELDYAQLILGAAASVLVPLVTLVLVLSKGLHPDLGWQTLWQLTVQGVSGGILTPVIFRLLDWLERMFLHPAIKPVPYRADRELKRGRY
jgi:cell shape-determining protein MreD